MANLLIDVLRSYVRGGEFIVQDFVIMPNHIHILMTIPGNSTLEKAMQLIKGNFSFRARKELEIRSEIWQRGFSDVRILDEQSFIQHQAYIEMNPVLAGLATAPNEYPYGSSYLKQQKRAGAKARNFAATGGTAEAVPDTLCLSEDNVETITAE